MRRQSVVIILALLFGVLFPGAAGAAPKEVRIFVVVDGVLKDYVEYFQTTIVPRATDEAFAMIPGNGGKPIVEAAFLTSNTAAGDSQIGLVYNGDRDRCYFTYDQAVLDRIYALAKQKKFKADRYLVIVAKNAVDGGCADGTTMFAGEGTPLPVFAHEMGHSFAGLFDEYGTTAGPPSAQCVRSRNCSTDKTNTPWKQENGLGAFASCDGYLTGIYHPAPVCLMNSTLASAFCTVCDRHLTDALTKGLVPKPPGCKKDERPSPWTQARTATVGLDVTAIIDDTNTIRILDAENTTDPDRLQPQVITGEAFVVGYRKREIVAVTPLAIDAERGQLTARSFSNALGTYEKRVRRPARLVRFTLLGIRKEDILTKDLDLELGVRWIEDPRDFFYVDDLTVTQLSGTSFGPTYDLQTALTKFLQ